jgi:hypothetical protein
MLNPKLTRPLQWIFKSIFLQENVLLQDTGQLQLQRQRWTREEGRGTHYALRITREEGGGRRKEGGGRREVRVRREEGGKREEEGGRRVRVRVRVYKIFLIST